MELIRVKSRLAQPYAGAFLKKEDRYVTKHHCFHFDLHIIVKNDTGIERFQLLQLGINVFNKFMSVLCICPIIDHEFHYNIVRLLWVTKWISRLL